MTRVKTWPVISNYHHIRVCCQAEAQLQTQAHMVMDLFFSLFFYKHGHILNSTLTALINICSL